MRFNPKCFLPNFSEVGSRRNFWGYVRDNFALSKVKQTRFWLKYDYELFFFILKKATQYQLTEE